MALYINVVVERWRQKVHRDTTIKGPFHLLDLATFLIELCDLEHIMLLTAMLRQEQIVVAVNVEVHVVRATDSSMFLNLRTANYLNA